MSQSARYDMRSSTGWISAALYAAGDLAIDRGADEIGALLAISERIRDSGKLIATQPERYLRCKFLRPPLRTR